MFTSTQNGDYPKRLTWRSLVYRTLHGLYGAGVAGALLYYYLTFGIIPMFSVIIAFMGVFMTLAGDIYVLAFRQRIRNRLVANVALFFPFECGATGCWIYTFLYTQYMYATYLDDSEYLLSGYVDDVSSLETHGGEDFYKVWTILIAVALGIAGISFIQSLLYLVVEILSWSSRPSFPNEGDQVTYETLARMMRL